MQLYSQYSQIERLTRKDTNSSQMYFYIYATPIKTASSFLFVFSYDKNICLAMKKTEFNPWIRRIHWRKEWQSTPVFLPGEFHGQKSLAGYSPWGCKESDMTK